MQKTRTNNKQSQNIDNHIKQQYMKQQEKSQQKPLNMNNRTRTHEHDRKHTKHIKNEKRLKPLQYTNKYTRIFG